MSLRFEDLLGLPPYGPMPEQFSATGRGTHRERCVVRFLPEGSEPWVGNFQRGTGSLEVTFEHPNQKNIVVVAGGTAYLVDVLKRQEESYFDDNLMHFLRASGEVVILGDSSQFLVFGRHEIWRTPRISLDGFRNLAVVGGKIRGDAFDPIDDVWLPFTVDLQTREVTGGSWLNSRILSSSQAPRPLKHRLMRTLPGVAASFGLSIPLSVALTILLLPLWRWIEEKFGLESVGHSGPAECCYLATFLTVWVLLLLLVSRLRRTQRTA